jgi:hypothetical protein
MKSYDYLDYSKYSLLAKGINIRNQPICDNTMWLSQGNRLFDSSEIITDILTLHLAAAFSGRLECVVMCEIHALTLHPR